MLTTSTKTTSGIISLESGSYKPGVCNIGPAEIVRRRNAGHLGLAITLIILFVELFAGWPAWARLITVLTAAGAASGYLQAYYRFCAGFGSRSLYNFERLGQTRRVTDSVDHAADMAMSHRIGVLALAIGLLFGLAAFALPVA
jgi:hypothetical protein